MDVTAPQLSYSSPYHWSYPNSDSELYSLSSPGTISPVSPQDVSFSSHMQACRGSTETHSRRTETFTSPSSSEEGRTSLSKLKTIRSKNTSKQRQTASEKEKLRMRDLTKALHHLRTYLPPSMAPAGQNLTKIETLRLTIRYISYLSAQLELSEDTLSQRREASVCQYQDVSCRLGYQNCNLPDNSLLTGRPSCLYSTVPMNTHKHERLQNFQCGLITSSEEGRTSCCDLLPEYSSQENVQQYQSAWLIKEEIGHDSILHQDAGSPQISQVYGENSDIYQQIVLEDLWI
ncbi:uncharacterized protein LOC127526183 [Erpetoichthys calabaricus]|uniref:uncharacterized protein LOC127526183 n=1 Tax=Erpetoichthys calabaricus TaxID=27687 RepID=UPI00223479CD|nr:uncharacterized protein LOC127526183 [Erpetoichthys calabaricus]